MLPVRKVFLFLLKFAPRREISFSFSFEEPKTFREQDPTMLSSAAASYGSFRRESGGKMRVSKSATASVNICISGRFQCAETNVVILQLWFHE